MKIAVFISAAFMAGLPVMAPSQVESLHHAHSPQRQSRLPLTAAQITGTYKAGEYGALDVQALPGGKVRFHFEGLAHLHSPGGPNIGDAYGTIPLHQNAAVYTDKEGGGRLILRFAPRRVFLSQSGSLGFGAGVVARGIYKKTSSRAPKFHPEDY